jgi:rubrerythrin
MFQARSGREAAADEFVEFHAAGERVTGEHRCSECGYGVAVYTALPRCPMCGGETWEPIGSRPLEQPARHSPRA